MSKKLSWFFWWVCGWWLVTWLCACCSACGLVSLAIQWCGVGCQEGEKARRREDCIVCWLFYFLHSSNFKLVAAEWGGWLEEEDRCPNPQWAQSLCPNERLSRRLFAIAGYVPWRSWMRACMRVWPSPCQWCYIIHCAYILAYNINI